MAALLTFGYGSNMCFGRMKARVKSIQLQALVRLLDYRFVVNKISKDASSKANIEQASGESVLGVLYSLETDDRDVLDKWEGVGEGYTSQNLRVHDVNNGTKYDARVYLATRPWTADGLWPYSWYKRHLVEGAREHGLPTNYLEMLESIDAVDDPDRMRDAAERCFPCSRPMNPQERALRLRVRRDKSPRDRFTDYASWLTCLALE